MLNLQGRTAVVTGGASGIGGACAELLQREGARVARWDIHASEQQRNSSSVIDCDVTDAESIAAATKLTIDRFGSPSLLVASAGICSYKPILEMDTATWDRTLAVNLRGVMLSVQAVAHEIVAANGDGAMVLIASVNGIVADPGISAYSASKAAVCHFARVAAREFGPYRIRINAIGPGPTDTPMMAPAIALPGYREEVIRRTPLGEVGTPQRIAEAVVGLMRMDWVTGQALMVDGGSSLNTGRGVWSVRQ
jgi:NAD(P)-dependent dehydrogenase (short-subunit alcohol dehydrogenase family)